MPTILVVEDSPTSRLLLVTVLGYAGYHVIEAADGAEALDLVRAQHPDLVISDVLMPTMDGIEFANLLHGDEAIAHIPVIFYTSTYRLNEARVLAQSCGVSRVLSKPSDPQVILDEIAIALGKEPAVLLPTAKTALPGLLGDKLPAYLHELVELQQRLHKALNEGLELIGENGPLRNVSDRLIDSYGTVQALSLRMAALLELGLVLSTERDPQQLLRLFCRAAQNIMNAKYAAVGINMKEGQPLHFVSCGMTDTEVSNVLNALDPQAGIFGAVLTDGKPRRVSDIEGDQTVPGLPASHPPVHTFLVVPVISRTGTHGWLYFANKIGANRFGEDDEQFAMTLSAQLAPAYENLILYEEVQQHAGQLEIEFTERKRAEQALRESEERYRQLWETTTDAIIMLGADSVIQYANPAVQDNFGYAPDELVGQNLAMIQPEKLRAGHRHGFKRYLETNVKTLNWRGTEAIALHRDGHEFPVEIAFSHMVIGGKPLFAAFIRDVTERKRAAEGLRESESRFRQLAENVHEVFFLIDPKNTQILYISPAYEEIWGRSCESLYAQPQSWLDAVHPDDLESVRKGNAERDATGQFEYEYRVIRPDQSIRWVRAHGSPIHNDAGEIYRVGGIAEDITERKLAEQAMEQLRRQHELILESLGEGIHGIDIEGRIIFENSAAVKMLGYHMEDLLGKPAHATMHHSKADGTPYPVEQCPIYASLRDGAARQVKDEVFWRRDGTSFPAEYTTTAIRNDRGDITWAVVAFRDITERKQAAEVHARLAAIVESSDDSIISKSMDGIITSWNNGAERLFGYSAEEIIGQPISLLIPPDRLEEETEFLHRLQQGKHLAHFETLRKHKDGGLINVSLTISPISDAMGRIVGASQIARNITEQKEQQEKIARLSRIYAVLSGINSAIVRIHDRSELFQEACRIAVAEGAFRMAWIGVIEPNALDGKIIASSGAKTRYLEKIKLTVRTDTPDSERPACRAVREMKPVICNDISKDLTLLAYKTELLKQGCHSIAAFPLSMQNRGVAVLVLLAAETGFFDEQELKLLNELAADIAFGLQYIEKEERLSYLAYYDALTGLPNSTLFHDRLTQFLQSAKHSNGTIAVILIDLDSFTQLNDTLGRHVGDMLLRTTAARLNDALREPYSLARISADSFAIAVADLQHGTDAAEILHKRIFKSLNRPYVENDIEVRISARAGIALYPGDGEDTETLFKNAEAALKQAQSTGTRYLYYAPQINAKAAEKLALESRLREAVEREQFVLHYQLKLDAKSGQIAGFEALIRWNDPNTGLVPPVDFIPVLERTGLILEVGQWVMKQALLDYHTWQVAGLQPPRIAVNVSLIQLQRQNFADVVGSVIKASGIDPQALELEITESLIMEDTEANIKTLQQIRDMGITIAIDDFGTGYSSLRYLASLPIDTLKIDRSFVITMTQDPNSMAIVSTIISLAHALGLSVVAEGVDSDEQSKHLRLMKCDEMQGYLFSKPIPADECAALLREQLTKHPESNHSSKK